MSLTLEIPRPLDEELTADAKREGISAAERATLLLYLVTALLNDEKPTLFREAVRVFLSHHSLDADHVATVFDELVRLCVEAQEEDEGSSPLQGAGGRVDVKRVGALLKHWRNAAVHRALDINPDVIIFDAGYLESLLQRAGREATRDTEEVAGEERDQSRVAHVKSIRGKYAHLGVTSDDLRRERRADEEISEHGLRGKRP